MPEQTQSLLERALAVKRGTLKLTEVPERSRKQIGRLVDVIDLDEFSGKKDAPETMKFAGRPRHFRRASSV